MCGELPSELGRLANLVRLELRGNQLTGKIPPELSSLANLLWLELRGNQLTGKIPPELGSLANLLWLELSDNQLSGEMPPELGSLARLIVLDFHDNQLTGEIPPEFDNLAVGLQKMNLGGNQLSGCKSDLLRDYMGDYRDDIPVCAPADHPGDTETIIALYNAWVQPDLENWLSREPISEWQGVSVDAGGRVAALNLNRAGLSGEIPPELGSLARLIVLDFHDNQLTGEIPPELGNLARLEVLYLTGNSLTVGIGKCIPSNTNVSLPYSRGMEVCITQGEFASVSAGPRHTCGVRTDGAVACWGENDYGQATPPQGEFASVSAGYSLTCGVRTDGVIQCWDD